MPDPIYTIDQFSSKGWGKTPQGLEIFGALPGEQVTALPSKKRPLLQAILSPSKERVQARCCHAMKCGGCTFQHLNYPAQLRLKQERVAEALKEALCHSKPKLHPIIGCHDPWRYRNKMEFSFSQNKSKERFLGLVLPGSKGKVLSLQECHLVSPWMIEALSAVKDWWEKSGLSAYHHSTDQGHLRTLTLREALQGSGRLAMLTVSGNSRFALQRSQLQGFAQSIQKLSYQGPLSLFLQIHQITPGKPTQFFEMHLSGPDHIKEKLFEFEFKISPTSFFQPNTKQAEILYAHAFAMLGQSETLLDLYCGTGTTSIIASKNTQKVIGIELNPHAIFDAQANAENNQIKNVHFVRGNVGKVLEQFKENIHAALIDPPRSGLDAQALDHLIKLKPKKILYISCNPKSQGENLLLFLNAGYRLVEVQPIDQCPHTIHIENLCLLKRP